RRRPERHRAPPAAAGGARPCARVAGRGPGRPQPVLQPGQRVQRGRPAGCARRARAGPGGELPAGRRLSRGAREGRLGNPAEAAGARQTYAAGGSFARQATGLVRQTGAFDVFIYNTNFINIAIGVTFLLLFLPAGAYPGANVYVSILLTVAVVLPTNL